MGRVDLMTATQEQKNQIYGYIRRALKSSPVDIVDADGLDSQDMRQHLSGEGIMVKTTKPMQAGQTLWERKPGQEVPASVFSFLAQVERQLNEDGSVTENEQGNALSGSRTLGEVNLVNQQSQINRAWAARQTSLGFQRLVRVFEEVARRWDTEPTVVDVFGTRLPVNDPDKEESWTSQMYLEPADVLIDSQSLTPQDDAQKGAQKLAQLDQLTPFVGQGVNREWFIRERLKAIGVKDSAEATAPEPAPDPMEQIMGMVGGGGGQPAMA